MRFSISWKIIRRETSMSEKSEKWFGLEETADYLGVTKDTVRNWIKKQIY